MIVLKIVNLCVRSKKSLFYLGIDENSFLEAASVKKNAIVQRERRFFILLIISSLRSVLLLCLWAVFRLEVNVHLGERNSDVVFRKFLIDSPADIAFYSPDTENGFAEKK